MRHLILLVLTTAPRLTAQEPARNTRQGGRAEFQPIQLVPASSGPLATRVSISLAQQPLSSIIAKIAGEARLLLVLDASQAGMERVHDVRLIDVPAREALGRVLAGTPFRAMVGAGAQVVIVRDPLAPRRDTAQAQPGARLRLSGYVRSLASQEVIRRAQLSIDDVALRVQGNDDGFYALLLAPGPHRLRVRAIGFAPFDTTFVLRTNTARDLLLATKQVTLATVSVQADAKGDRPDLDPRTPDMSVVRLDLASVKLLPPVLGEPDPIRSLTLLPGVSLSSDASTSFSVRGGAADQNLFLLDEATIYNPSHILGFLSTFNTDAVDNVTLYKGAIPARFGGRLSSVVDVRQREGNANEFVGSAAIGLLASRLSLEGPLPRTRGSYMLAARRSYADLFTGLSSDSTIRDVSAYFYDVNAKANLPIGSSGTVMLSGYLGRDQFRPSTDFGAGWGNKAATLRWNQAIGGRLFSKLTAALGDYDYQLTFVRGLGDSVSWKSRIRSLDLKLDETFYLSPNSSLEFGLQYTDQEFRPGRVVPLSPQSSFEQREVSPRYGVAPAAYLGQDVRFGTRLAVRYGVRYAGFIRQGPATVYRYRDDAAVVYNSSLARYESGQVIDSTTYGATRRVGSFWGLEPRLSASLMLSDASSVKASYSRTQQFLLLASKTNSVSPLDVWEPVGPFIKPQVADQFAIGFNRTTAAYELSLEGYYKVARNVVDFIDGADIILNPRPESQLLQGHGRAYGLELLARRSAGSLTGWVSYTLGRSEQRIPLPAAAIGTAGGGINGGNWYPNPFDKTHNLSVVAIRPLGKHWTLGSTFTLASGLPTTFPVARYVVDGLLLTEYGPRNSSRLPLYHRLDLSATRKFSRSELQFGVLNAYNRFNAQALRFRQQVLNPLAAEAVQTSIFGIVPSVTFVFHF